MTRLVYAVFARKHNVCHPTSEEIMALRTVKVREVDGRVRTRYYNIDTTHPFYTYFDTPQERENAFFAYKMFIGACLSGDDARV